MSKGIIKEILTGISVWLVATVVLMKAEALKQNPPSIFDVAAYLVLISCVIALMLWLYGQSDIYLKHTERKFHERPVIVGGVVFIIVVAIPDIVSWWQSEASPSFTLIQWHLFDLPKLPNNLPDWLVPLFTAGLMTYVCYLFMRFETQLALNGFRQGWQRAVEERDQTITKLNKAIEKAQQSANDNKREAFKQQHDAEMYRGWWDTSQQELKKAREQVHRQTQTDQAAAIQIEELTGMLNQEQQQVRRERSEKAALVKQIQGLREELAAERRAQLAAPPAQANPTDALLDQLSQRLLAHAASGIVAAPQVAPPTLTGGATQAALAAPASPPSAVTDALLERWQGAENWELLLRRKNGELIWQLKKDGIEQALTEDQQAVLRYLYQQGGVPTAPAAMRDNIAQITGAAVSYDNIKKILGRMRERGLVGYSEGKGYFLVHHNQLQ